MPDRPSTPGGATAEQDAEARPVPAPDDEPALVQTEDPAAPAAAAAPESAVAPAPPAAPESSAAPESPESFPSATSPPDGPADLEPRPAEAPVTAEEPRGDTAVIPTADDQPRSADAPTGPVAAPAAVPGRRRWRRRALLVTSGVVVALALLYVGDLVGSAGTVARGVTVAGVPVGGLALGDAAQTLRTAIDPRTHRPFPVTAGDATGTIDPGTAGLSLDWPATLARVGDRPLNPITRVASFFGTREIGVVTRSDPAALAVALTGLRPAFDRPAVEGSIRFDGVVPRPAGPVPGRRLDVPAAAAVLVRDWASGGPVALPLTPIPPVTTPADVTAALEKVAAPAVSGPVTIDGEKAATATLTPQDIAAALTFRAERGAGLVPALAQDALVAVLTPQLAGSETPGRDASLDVTSGATVVVPSQDGRRVDYPATVAGLLPVLTGPGPRKLAAVYGERPAALTTDGLAELGISGIIGEFTTHGFAADSGANIRRAAGQIDGTIVRPGATFSLNAATNPRDAAHGYVDAGIIEDGHPARGIGGGVSQVATTLYNAAYFAGMTDVEHKEHSFYIGRYPAGREATVFDDLIDLEFRNDDPTAAMIQTVWAPGSITVRIYGTKRYDVTSTSGPRTDPTEPRTVTIPAGEPCHPGKGAPGFTISNTRTLREISTGRVRAETRSVHYNPSPILVCAPDQ